MEVKSIFTAEGVVIGNLWGGGTGAYPSTKLGWYKSKKSLLTSVRRLLKTGALDSGMGFAGLIGAFLNIAEVKSIDYNGEIFTRTVYTNNFVGKLTDEQKDFLMDSYCKSYRLSGRNSFILPEGGVRFFLTNV